MKRSEFVRRITAALDLSDAGEIAAAHAEKAGVKWDPEQQTAPGRVCVIYGSAHASDQEEAIRFRLIPGDNPRRPSVYLAAVREDGEVDGGGLLVQIFGDTGTMRRVRCVDRALGLRLDYHGRVMLEE